MRSAAIALALIASTAVNAEELSAGQLYAFCTSKEEVAISACRFFVLGAVLGIQLGDGGVVGSDRKIREREKTHFCLPGDVGQSQMVEVFQKTIRLLVTEYPEDLKLPAVSIVDVAMNKAFPCRK